MGGCGARSGEHRLQGAGHRREGLAIRGLGSLHSITQEDRTHTQPGTLAGSGPLQESLLFLLFLRKDGVRNFFFFLDGDLPGDPSLPGSTADPSSAAGGTTSSATGAEAGSRSAAGAGVGLVGPWTSSSSTVEKPSASEGSSGDRSGSVGLKVAASLSSPEAGSCGRSGSRGGRRALGLLPGHQQLECQQGSSHSRDSTPFPRHEALTRPLYLSWV